MISQLVGGLKLVWVGHTSKWQEVVNISVFLDFHIFSSLYSLYHPTLTSLDISVANLHGTAAWLNSWGFESDWFYHRLLCVTSEVTPKTFLGCFKAAGQAPTPAWLCPFLKWPSSDAEREMDWVKRLLIYWNNRSLLIFLYFKTSSVYTMTVPILVDDLRHTELMLKNAF